MRHYTILVDHDDISSVIGEGYNELMKLHLRKSYSPLCSMDVLQLRCCLFISTHISFVLIFPGSAETGVG